MKYRKKPMVIEAFRWDGVNDDASYPQWMIHALRSGVATIWKLNFPMGSDSHIRVIRIRRLEGIYEARPGDWIIRGSDGELYPCKPDIFEMMYEPVGEPSM